MSQVTIFSKANCRPCIDAKGLFNIKNIDYKEEPLLDNIEELISMGFQSAPVFKIGDRYTSELSTAIKLVDNA